MYFKNNSLYFINNVGILSGGSGGVEKYSTIDEQAGANHLRITSGEAASNE